MNSYLQILSAFLGTLGFSVVFGSKKSHILYLSLGGALSWTIYLISEHFGAGEALCYFLAATVIGIYSEILARILKTPATNVFILGFIPLIPGSLLYHTMRYAFSEQWNSFFESGTRTLEISLAIAMGIISVSTVVKLLHKLGALRHEFAPYKNNKSN